MNLLLLISIALSGVVPLAGCRQDVPAQPQVITMEQQPAADTPKHAEYRKLTAQEAKAQLDKDKAIKLVDVRTEAEYQEKRIPNSILIPDYDIETLAPKLLPDKDEKIFLYCRSGRRSKAAAMKLVGMGYTNVYDFGGIIDWPYDTMAGK